MNKLNVLSKKEKMAVLEFEQLLLNRFPKVIRRLILFGSKARGDSNRASDLDILVVVSKNGKRIRQEIASLTHEPILHFEILLSPIIVEEGFFKKWSPLLQHIREEGIIWTGAKVKENM